MNLSPTGIRLKHVEYPEHIIAAAGDVQPGADVTFEDALRASIRIAKASPTRYKIFENEKYGDGPFGALQVALIADETIRLLLSLQGKDPTEVVETLLSTKGYVISLGWNSVNAALHEDIFRDEDGHAEMIAMRNAGRALPIPVAAMPDHNLCVGEFCNAENCDACKARSVMWGSTAFSIFAILTREVLEKMGFDEGEACKIDSRDPRLPHVAEADFSQKHLDMTSVYVPGMNADALEAFDAYKELGGRNYQPDFGKIIETEKARLAN